MKKALFVASVASFLGWFETSDISILQSLGYTVHCAANIIDCNQERRKILEKTNTEIHHIPFKRNPFSKKNFRAYAKLRELILSENFDIIHCHTPTASVFTRILARSLRKLGTQVIYTAHGFHFFKGCPMRNRMIYYPVEKLMSRYTDILITINNEDYEVALSKFNAKRTEHIHGVGIDIDKFRKVSNSRKTKREELGIRDGEKFLLSVGELDRDKNHIEVLEAMKILGEKGYKFYIAGNGNLKDFYVRYIHTNKLENCVFLLGYRTDIPELLQAADIYVFPSLFEGLSVALMEAVAAKLPIACSEVRGNVDTVITPESYFPTNSPSKLVEVIQNISAMSEEEKTRMVETNYQNLLKYRLSEVQKEMRAIYEIADEAVEKARQREKA